MKDTKTIFLRRRNELFALGCLFLVCGVSYMLRHSRELSPAVISFSLGYWTFPIIGIYALLATAVCSKTQKLLGYLSYDALLSLSKSTNCASDNENLKNIFARLSIKEKKRFHRKIRWCALLMNKKFHLSVWLLGVSMLVMAYELMGSNPDLFTFLFCVPLMFGWLLFFLAIMDVM